MCQLVHLRLHPHLHSIYIKLVVSVTMHYLHCKASLFIDVAADANVHVLATYGRPQPPRNSSQVYQPTHHERLGHAEKDGVSCAILEDDASLSTRHLIRNTAS